MIYDSIINDSKNIITDYINNGNSKKEIQKTKSYQGGLLTPKKKVSKYDNEGVLIEIYESVSEASEKNNILMPNMSRLLKNEKSQNHTYQKGRIY